jgi:Tfp pilus assembly protein PilO
MKRWRVPAAGLLVGMLMVAGYVVRLHGPRSDEIAELASQADQLRSLQEPLRREIKGLEEVASREAEFNTALRLLEGLIPSGLTQPALLLQLQEAAERAGVKLVSVTFGDPKVPEGAPNSPVAGTVLAAMPLTVVVEGPFVDITDLLHDVEVDLARAVLIGSLALTEADVGFPQLTGTWSGQAYALLRPDDPLLVGTEGSTARPAPAPAPGKP